jgi:AcrR family transcriptional regulator
MSAKPKGRRAEHTEDTRNALVHAARLLFSTKGYADAGIEEIVASAGVTRGSLYHHFSSKEDLFRAVLAEVAAEAMDLKSERQRVQSQTLTEGAWSWHQLSESMWQYLDLCLEPEYRQVMLIDGPAVLGFEECLVVAEEHGMATMIGLLHDAVDRELIADVPVTPLAHLLSGLVSSAAVYIVRSPDREEARQETLAVLECVMDGLRLSNRARTESSLVP